MENEVLQEDPQYVNEQGYNDSFRRSQQRYMGSAPMASSTLSSNYDPQLQYITEDLARVKSEVKARFDVLTSKLNKLSLDPSASLYNKRSSPIEDAMSISKLEENMLLIKSTINLQEQQCVKRFRKVSSMVEKMQAQDESLLQLNEQLVHLKRQDRESTFAMDENRTRDIYSRLESLEGTLINHSDVIIGIQQGFQHEEVVRAQKMKEVQEHLKAKQKQKLTKINEELYKRIQVLEENRIQSEKRIEELSLKLRDSEKKKKRKDSDDDDEDEDFSKKLMKKVDQLVEEKVRVILTEKAPTITHELDIEQFNQLQNMITVCHSRVLECDQKLKAVKDWQRKYEDRTMELQNTIDKKHSDALETTDIVEREVRALKRKVANILLMINPQYDQQITEKPLPRIDETFLGEQENIFLSNLARNRF